MSTQSINRQPAGTPRGGQFSAGSTSEVTAVELVGDSRDGQDPHSRAAAALVSVHTDGSANHAYLVTRGVLPRLDHQTFRLAHTEMQAASDRVLPQVAAGWVARDAVATPSPGLRNGVPGTSPHHNLASAFAEATNPFNGRDDTDLKLALRGVFNEVDPESVDDAFTEFQRCLGRASDFRAGQAQWGDDEDDDESFLDDPDDEDRSEQAADMWERHAQLVADQLVHDQLAAVSYR